MAISDVGSRKFPPGRWFIPAGVILYWICHIVFYPGYYSIQDERVYLARAHEISRGVFFPAETARSDAAVSMDKYPAGAALLLSLFLKVHPRAVYLLNPILLTLLTLMLAHILRRCKIPEYFALLALFHPVMLIFSRTVMSDPPAAFFFLLAVLLLFYHKKALFFGALALGFTLSLRVALAPASSLVFLIALWRFKKERLAFFLLLAGFLLGVAPFMLYLRQTDLFAPAAYASDIKNVSAFLFFPRFLHNFLSLNLIYPGMLVIGLIPRYKESVAVKSACVTAVAILSFFVLFTGGEGVMGLALTQRFFLFILAPLLIGYSRFLHQRVFTSPNRFIILFIPLVAGAFVLAPIHQKRLDRNRAFHDVIYQHTTENALLIIDDKSEELAWDPSGARRILNIEIAREPARILAHVEKAQSRGADVFVILLDRDPGKKRTPGHGAPFTFILNHFKAEEVAAHENEWQLKILKLP